MFWIRHFFNVYRIEISNFTAYVTLKDVKSDESGLIWEWSQLILVFFGILYEVSGDSILLQGNFSVFGLQMEVNFCRLLAVNFEVNDTLLARLILISFYLLYDLWLCTFLSVLELFQTFLIAKILSCAFYLIDEREPFISHYFYPIFDWPFDLEILSFPFLQFYCLEFVQS